MGSLNDIAVFVEVIKRGSFTAAAESLDMSRPVVSRCMTRLENQLGVRLVHRTTRRLSLTEAGHHFYDQCRSGLSAIHEAEAEVQQMQSAPRGVLRLNTPMSFGILHVAPLLADFYKNYPDVTVEMSLEDRMLDVVDDGFDLSVRITDLPDSSMVARRICECRHAIVASASYLDSMGIPEIPQDLTKHRILAYRYQDSRHEWHFRKSGGEHQKVSLSAHTQINNSMAIMAAVQEGLGIARMPTFIAGPEIRAGKLVPLLQGWEILQVSVFLVYPQRRFLSPKVRAFIDFMADRIADPPAWDSY